jgi:hypothetical protein
MICCGTCGKPLPGAPLTAIGVAYCTTSCARKDPRNAPKAKTEKRGRR